MEKNVNTTQQLKRIQTDKGFIAALDQSGGSTPKALQLYGISDDNWRALGVEPPHLKLSNYMEFLTISTEMKKKCLN